MVSTILWLANIRGAGFVGDLIGVIYLLTIPSLGMIIGASASSNPLSSVGASREMKLVLAYELPFVIAIFTAVTKVSPMTLRLDGILDYQAAHGVLLGNASCIIAFIVAILCAQAKLTYPPVRHPGGGDGADGRNAHGVLGRGAGRSQALPGHDALHAPDLLHHDILGRPRF